MILSFPGVVCRFSISLSEPRSMDEMERDFKRFQENEKTKTTLIELETHSDAARGKREEQYNTTGLKDSLHDGKTPDFQHE